MSYNGSGTFVINTAGQPVVSGTVISSTAFNALTADLATGLSTAITKDGQTTPTANIPMGNNKITGLAVGTAATDAANLSQAQSTASKLITVSGTDTVTGTLSPTLAAYAAGQMFYWVAAGTNTGAVTLNIDSLGAKAVTRDGSTALAAGDIRSGEVVVVVYDGTRFQVVSQINSAGDATFANVSITSALNVGGVATFTSNPVLSGGTANGVLYLNGSKAATSGSALTFDGTSLNAGSALFPSGRIRLKQPDDTTKQKGLIIEAAADDSILAIGYDGTSFTYNATYNSTGGYKPQAWWVSGSEQMRLNSTGLGIGTSSPDQKLVVTGQQRILSAAASFTGSGVGLEFFYNSSDSTGYLQSYDRASSVYKDMYIRADTLKFSSGTGTERARITSGGDLLVGTTSSSGRLTVYRSTEETAFFSQQDAATNTPTAIIRQTVAGGNGDNDIGVQVDIQGQNDTSRIITGRFWNGGSPTTRFYVQRGGSVYNNTGTYGTISDQTLKQDIVDAPSQWDDVKAIRFRKYRMKADVEANADAPALFGVVAQELEQVSPGLVQDGEVKTVKTSILLMKAAKALQEAMARIEQLEADVATLKGA